MITNISTFPKHLLKFALEWIAPKELARYCRVSKVFKEVIENIFEEKIAKNHGWLKNPSLELVFDQMHSELPVHLSQCFKFCIIWPPYENSKVIHLHALKIASLITANKNNELDSELRIHDQLLMEYKESLEHLTLSMAANFLELKRCEEALINQTGGQTFSAFIGRLDQELRQMLRIFSHSDFDKNEINEILNILTPFIGEISPSTQFLSIFKQQLYPMLCSYDFQPNLKLHFEIFICMSEMNELKIEIENVLKNIDERKAYLQVLTKGTFALKEHIENDMRKNLKKCIDEAKTVETNYLLLENFQQIAILLKQPNPKNRKEIAKIFLTLPQKIQIKICQEICQGYTFQEHAVSQGMGVKEQTKDFLLSEWVNDHFFDDLNVLNNQINKWIDTYKQIAIIAEESLAYELYLLINSFKKD